MVGERTTNGVVFMLGAAHYVLSGCVGTNDTVQKGLHLDLDTGDGYNIIRRNALTLSWKQCIDTQIILPSLNDSNVKPL